MKIISIIKIIFRSLLILYLYKRTNFAFHYVSDLKVGTCLVESIDNTFDPTKSNYLISKINNDYYKCKDTNPLEHNKTMIPSDIRCNSCNSVRYQITRCNKFSKFLMFDNVNDQVYDSHKCYNNSLNNHYKRSQNIIRDHDMINYEFSLHDNNQNRIGYSKIKTCYYDLKNDEYSFYHPFSNILLFGLILTRTLVQLYLYIVVIKTIYPIFKSIYSAIF